MRKISFFQRRRVQLDSRSHRVLQRLASKVGEDISKLKAQAEREIHQALASVALLASNALAFIL